MTRTRRSRAKKWPQRTGAEKVRTHVVVQNRACGIVGGPLLKAFFEFGRTCCRGRWLRVAGRQRSSSMPNVAASRVVSQRIDLSARDVDDGFFAQAQLVEVGADHGVAQAGHGYLASFDGVCPWRAAADRGSIEQRPAILPKPIERTRQRRLHSGHSIQGRRPSARLLGLNKCRHGCAREPKKTKCLINHCNRLDDELNSDKSLISFIGILSVYSRLLPGGYIIPRYTDLY